jgi:NADH-quinone oxidoreductase subunit L
MVLPLIILAVCSAVVGVVCEWGHSFADFLITTPSLAYSPLHQAAGANPFEMHTSIAAISTVAALIGIGLAAFLYLGPRDEVEVVTRMAEGRDPRAYRPGGSFAYRFLALGPVRSLYHVSHGKFFLDEIYNALIVWPLRGVAAASAWFDRNVIDGLVDLVGRVPRWLGSSLRSLQPGMVQFYALAMVLGLIVLVGSLLMWPAS